MSLPIRARLTAWYVGLLAVILAVLGAFLAVRLRADLVSSTDRTLDTRAEQISLGLKGGCEGEFRDVSGSSLTGLPQGESGAQLLSPSGAVVESSGDTVASRPLVSGPVLSEVLAGHRLRETVTPGGEPFRILAVRMPPGGCNDAIVVATSLEDVNASVHRLAVLLLVAVPVVLAAAGAGGWWLARKALAPVSAMTRAAREIGIGDLDERVDVPRSSDELKRLATTLNSMLDRLQEGVEGKRRFISDASHELRTPLAIMGSELDVSLQSGELAPEVRQVLSSTREEVGRMSRIVENLLAMAHVDEGRLELLTTRVQLRDLADAVADSMGSLARSRDIRLAVEGNGGAVQGDRERLQQVVANLVENAVKYSPTGTEVRICVWRKDDAAGMTVIDRGPGVPPDMRARVFERFFRVDRSRSRAEGGAGLGLAICREIIEAHGGRIWVHSEDRGGSSFSFSLPVPIAASV